MIRNRFLLCALFVASGCGTPGDVTNDAGDGGVGDGGGPDGAGARVSFGRHVQPILDRYCIECHAGSGESPFYLDRERAYASLTTSRSSFCDLPLVTPGVPEQSALWIKLAEDISDTEMLTLRCGREMPPLGEGSLWFIDRVAAETVREWIVQGANEP